jgi:pimeloyl-ACP methyl ester carboxylesterase
LPGYGDSEGGDTLHDMLAITLHCFDVIEALRLARPYLVGHSMGGMIAAEMAAVAPHDVERLGLIAPAGLWLDDYPIPDLFAKLPHELPELLFHDPALGERLMAPGGDLDDPKLLEAFMIRNARRLTMASKLLFPVPDRGLAERLYRIRARTVIVWGEDDAPHGARADLWSVEEEARAARSVGEDGSRPVLPDQRKPIGCTMSSRNPWRRAPCGISVSCP